MIQSFDYRLTLNTGEDVHVCELDPGLVSELADPDVARAAAPWLARCTRAPRAAMEEAKRGHSRALDALLRTPPVGVLIKMESPLCGLLKACSMADRKGCSTRNIDPKKNLGKFPMCWEPDLPGVGNSEARELVAYVVRAWRDGRYVVIVDG